MLDLSMVVTLAAPRLSSHLGQVLLNLFFDSLGLKASTIAILTAASCCILENDLHQRTNPSNLATPLLLLNLVLWKCTVTDLFLLRILCQPFGQEVNSVLLASLTWHWSTTASIAIERIELVRGNWETVTTGTKNGPVMRPPGHNKYGLRILWILFSHLFMLRKMQSQGWNSTSLQAHPFSELVVYSEAL